jgi:hypothetical protein
VRTRQECGSSRDWAEVEVEFKKSLGRCGSSNSRSSSVPRSQAWGKSRSHAPLDPSCLGVAFSLPAEQVGKQVGRLMWLARGRAAGQGGSEAQARLRCAACSSPCAVTCPRQTPTPHIPEHIQEVENLAARKSGCQSPINSPVCIGGGQSNQDCPREP